MFEVVRDYWHIIGSALAGSWFIVRTEARTAENGRTTPTDHNQRKLYAYRT